METFSNIFELFHSIWRWVVLVLIIIVTIRSLIGWLGKQSWTNLDSALLRYSSIAVRVQVALGLILFIFILLQGQSSMGILFGHIVPALLAVGGVEFGVARATKATGNKKFMFAFIGFIIALVLVIGALGAVLSGR